jgi:hypothetical protein
MRTKFFILLRELAGQTPTHGDHNVVEFGSAFRQNLYPTGELQGQGQFPPSYYLIGVLTTVPVAPCPRLRRYPLQDSARDFRIYYRTYPYARIAFSIAIRGSPKFLDKNLVIFETPGTGVSSRFGPTGPHDFPNAGRSPWLESGDWASPTELT